MQHATQNNLNPKNSFRAMCKKLLLAQSKKPCIFGDKKITKLLKSEFVKHRKTHTNILVYVPLRMEVNILPFVFWLKKQRGVRVFAPFVVGESFRIVPFRLPLRKNTYNIYEASPSNIYFNKIHISIVPIICMDMNYKRIGFGKGMYDRFYASLKHKPMNIFVARNLYCANANITDAHDITGDIVIAKYNEQKRGNYDIVDNSWILNSYSISRLYVFYHKKNLYPKNTK